MRILLLTQYFWPENFPINDIVRGLRDRGHELQVLTGMPNYPEGRLFPGYRKFHPISDSFDGIPVARVPLITRGRGQGWRLALNYLSFAAAATTLGPRRCQGHPDVILVYQLSPVTVGIPALVLKRIKNAPILLWVQDLWPESLAATGAVRAPWILNAVGTLTRHIYRNCDRIAIQSRAFIEPIRALGVDPQRIRYLPNSAETLYQPVTVEPEAPERALVPQGFCVMYAGNIGAAQDFGTILAAAEQLKSQTHIHWVILGDGRQRAWVEQRVRERALETTVHLIGRHPKEAMPRLFALADALLVSLREEPIFALTIPTKVQSYLACGRPIIAALDGEGARVIEEAQAGLTVPASNPERLAKAVLALSRMDPAQRQTMGMNGLAYARRHFDPEVLLDRLECFMREVVAPSTP